MKNLIWIFLLSLLLPWSALAQTKVVILGDSLTAGYGVEKHQAFPALVQAELQRRGYGDVQIINGGISGSTSASALGRLKWFLRIKPQLLILELGANDGLRGVPVASLKENLRACLQLAQAQKLPVLLVGMRMPPNYGETYTKEFAQVFLDLAQEFNLPLLPFLLEGVAGHPDLNIPDAIHPNAEGHKILAQNLLVHLLPLLPPKSP